MLFPWPAPLVASLLAQFGARLLTRVKYFGTDDAALADLASELSPEHHHTYFYTGHPNDLTLRPGFRHHREAVLLESCGDLSGLDASYFDQSNLWLLATEEDSCSPPPALRLDSLFLTATKNNNSNDTWEIKERYSVKGNAPMVQKLGTWSEERGLQVPVPHIWERRADLHGAVLAGSAINFSVQTILNNGSLSGMSPEFVDAVLSGANASLLVTTPPDGAFGSPEGNGSGIVGQILRGEADFSITMLESIPER